MHVFDSVLAGPWNMEMDARDISYTRNPAIYSDVLSSRVSTVAFPEGKLFTHTAPMIPGFGIVFHVYCIVQEKHEDAVAVLEKLYPPEQLEEQVQGIMVSVNSGLELSNSTSVGWLESLKRREVRSALVVGVGLQVKL